MEARCELEAAGKPYPRTCPVCKLGPCQRFKKVPVDPVKSGLPAPAVQQEKLTEMCERIELEEDAMRRLTIRECVTWLAMHHGDYKPECLAGAMACDLLTDNS